MAINRSYVHTLLPYFTMKQPAKYIKFPSLPRVTFFIIAPIIAGDTLMHCLAAKVKRFDAITLKFCLLI